MSTQKLNAFKIGLNKAAGIMAEIDPFYFKVKEMQTFILHLSLMPFWNLIKNCH